MMMMTCLLRSMDRRGFIVTEISPNGPSGKSRLIELHDMLVAVDTLSLRDLNTKQAAELLRGVNGSKVKLALMKGTTRFSVTLVRECIDDYEKCHEKRHFGTSSSSPLSSWPSPPKPYPLSGPLPRSLSPHRGRQARTASSRSPLQTHVPRHMIMTQHFADPQANARGLDMHLYDTPVIGLQQRFVETAQPFQGLPLVSPTK
jgi:hypothetical protein